MSNFSSSANRSAPSTRGASSAATLDWRPIIMIGTAMVILGVFWISSRYPSLFGKAASLGKTLPSMAFSSQLMTVGADASVWMRILAASVNWLDGMKIGMTFGVLFGALLHTVLRYYPLKVGNNLYLNSLKGPLLGVPAGVCANCAVPVACGVTRGNGRVEVALGFLFSSPNFNPVVVMMTFVALPLAMSITKYAVLFFVILFLVPTLIRWLERDQPPPAFSANDQGGGAAPSNCRWSNRGNRSPRCSASWRGITASMPGAWPNQRLA